MTALPTDFLHAGHIRLNQQYGKCNDLPLAPTITGAGEITSWEINATLPDGLSFGATNGTIWGTPTELWTTTAYMVWANNSGGSSVAYLNITVVDELPDTIQTIWN